MSNDAPLPVLPVAAPKIQLTRCLDHKSRIAEIRSPGRHGRSQDVIADRPADSPQPVGLQRLPDLKMVRILAVDDDPQARALIEIALTDAPFHYDLEVVTTAASGIRRIASGEHDVYLIDQQL